MTAEEIKHIQDIQGTAGFRVIQYEAKQMLEKMKDITTVDKNDLVAEQTLGRQLLYEVLEKFLSDINLTSKTENTTRRTYE